MGAHRLGDPRRTVQLDNRSRLSHHDTQDRVRNNVIDPLGN